MMEDFTVIFNFWEVGYIANTHQEALNRDI